MACRREQSGDGTADVIGQAYAAQRRLRGFIAQGLLVEASPQWRAPAMPVSLLCAHRRQLPRRMQAFMGWMAVVLVPELA